MDPNDLDVRVEPPLELADEGGLAATVRSNDRNQPTPFKKAATSGSAKNSPKKHAHKNGMDPPDPGGDRMEPSVAI